MCVGVRECCPACVCAVADEEDRTLLELCFETIFFYVKRFCVSELFSFFVEAGRVELHAAGGDERDYVSAVLGY